MNVECLMREFCEDRYTVATFGSSTEQEQDLLVIDRTGNAEAIAESVRAFADRLSRVRLHDTCRIIVQHNHRAYVKSPNTCLHLLFYPSLQHMVAWELPSFLAYVYLNARVLHGSLADLEPHASAYSRREIVLAPQDLISMQQIAYDKIAMDSVVYRIQHSEVYGAAVSSEDLCYVTRFSLAEYYLAAGLAELGSASWSWHTVRALTTKHFPDWTFVLEILDHGSRHVTFPDNDSLLANLLGYFALRDDLLELRRKGACNVCGS